MFSDTCAPVKNDVLLGFGENHTFSLQFKTARPLSSATCTLTIRHNNTDDTILMTQNGPIVSNAISFSITPDECRTFGAGVFYYDIWMRDGADFEKPIVAGLITILALTTRVQP